MNLSRSAKREVAADDLSVMECENVRYNIVVVLGNSQNNIKVPSDQIFR